MREKISLNGTWEWRIPGGDWQDRQVPGSYRCVGTATYRRNLELLPQPGSQRLFLCFDGITFGAQVRFNDVVLGEMGPFTPYEFEITSAARAGSNTLEVEVSDILAPYGPVIGWEAYAGLIRGVYLEPRPAAFIADCYWRTTFPEDYGHAQAEVSVVIDAEAEVEDADICAALSFGGNHLAGAGQYLSLQPGRNQVDLLITLDGPNLWSPEEPNLYNLAVTLSSGVVELDRQEQKVGFREFRV
ncbi:MAG: glycosyl hydrolase 2 galactose-binding domain-containing protein, partial [Anaerolineae bacterium]